MRAKENVLRHEEGVLHVAGRMLWGEIQRSEIMIVVFNIGSCRDGETHPRKNAFQFLHRLSDGVFCAGGPDSPGGGNVSGARRRGLLPREGGVFVFSFPL